MSLALCILASGSSGNCSLLRTPDGVVLIDAGVGPRTFGRVTAGTGVTLDDVKAVVLTHLDSDHFRRSWVNTLVRRQITVHCHADHAAECDVAADLGCFLRPFSGAFEPIDGVTFNPFACAHDSSGSYGYVIDGHNGRIGFATDLGHVPSALIEHFEDLDVLAIESNYDPDLQRNSGRPFFLQRRITGGRGHLSNDQALAAVKAIFDRHKKRTLPKHVVLLHRSADCNCPDLVRRLYERDARIGPRLVLAERHEPTAWMCAGTGDTGRQLMFAF